MTLCSVALRQASKDAAAERLPLQHLKRLEKVKDLGHQMPNLCILRLKGIQRGQVARSFFGSGQPRTASLRESKFETSGQMPRRAAALGE